MQRILITGGAGYIGSALTKVLANEGHEVISLDKKFSHYQRISNNIEEIKCDLLDFENLRKITSRVDIIIHLAAEKSVVDSGSKALEYYESNYHGTINLIKAQILNQTKYIIFASSAAVYSTSNEESVDENHDLMPRSIYGKTKLLAEEYINRTSVDFNYHATTFRFFNVAGNLQNDTKISHSNNVFAMLFEKSIKNQKFAIYGNRYNTVDGTCVRDYVHISDVIDAIVLRINQYEIYNDNPSHKIYNVGTGKGTSILQLIDKFKQITGRNVNIIFEKPRIGEIPKSVASLKKINNELDWKPTKNVEDIITSSWRQWTK